jgi:2-oxoglutarate ferredoxin oxidoreductase subunit gamma
VIISDSPINFPKVIQPNVLVCLTQESYNKFYDIIRPGGLLISDSRYRPAAAEGGRPAA